MIEGEDVMLSSGFMGGSVGFAVRIFLKVYLMAILSCSRWIMSSPSPVVATTTSQTSDQHTEVATMREEPPRYVDYEYEDYGVPQTFVEIVAGMQNDHIAIIANCDAVDMCDYLEDLGEILWPTVQGMSC